MKLTKRLAAVILTAALSLVMLTACTNTLPPDLQPGLTPGGGSSDSGDGKTDASPDTQLDAYRQEVLRLVNAERTSRGIAPLSMSNSRLTNAAQKRADEITITFSHTRPNGTQCSTVLDEYSVSWRAFGENIAAGYPTPASVVEGWMNSPGHRANILNSSYTQIGIGYVYDSTNHRAYWSQIFVG